MTHVEPLSPKEALEWSSILPEYSESFENQFGFISNR